MCGRFTQSHTWRELYELYRLTCQPVNIEPRYNIAPATMINVVVPHGTGRDLPTMRWGLITAPIVVRNEEVIELSGTTADEFDAACASELEEIERRRQLYIGDRARAEIAGQVVIVIDDGIATGATTRAALQAIRNRKPKGPVAPPELIAKLRQEVDALICLETPELFGAIGYFYRDFRQVSDQEVVAILKRFPAKRPASIA